MATEVPREKLKELIEKNGDGLFQDRDRCEGLLKDYCGGYRREISAIVGALEERIPVELKSSWQTAMTPEAMRARLVQRLEDNRGLAPEIANYAVDTWSYALGVGLGRSSDRVQDVPVVVQNGFAPVASAAERAAADRPAGSSSAGSTSTGVAPPPPAAGKPLGSIGALSNQNKALVGGAGLLAAAAIAFAVLHHPQVAAPPTINTPPAQNGQNGQNTPPAQDGQNGQNTPPQNPPSIPSGGSGSSTPSGQTGQPATDSSASHDHGTSYPQPKASSSVSSGISVVVRLDTDFNSDNATVGQLLPATVVTPVTSDGNVIVPRGANAQLQVVSIDKSGKISGKSHVQLALVGLKANGKLLHISGSTKGVDGPSQGVRTAERTGIGTAAGAALGALTGKLFHHAGTGAMAGAGAGGATGALTSHPAPVKVSSETVLQFRLAKGIGAGT
jgi:YMGG-like Gly-zipper